MHAFSSLAMGLAAGLALMAGAAAGEPSLLGRAVSFGTLTYDDPARPIFQGMRHRAVVGPGVEFGLSHEGPQNGLDVVPAIVDIGADRVVVSFAIAPPGRMSEAEFNGYVLAFDAECALFDGARIDAEATTMAVAADAVSVTPSSVSVNLSGLPHGRLDVLAVELEVSDCALS